jgi:hypothetical protein
MERNKRPLGCASFRFTDDAWLGMTEVGTIANGDFAAKLVHLVRMGIKMTDTVYNLFRLAV